MGRTSRDRGLTPQLHVPSWEIFFFPAIYLLFPWSLAYLKILEPRSPHDAGQSWARQEWELRQARLPLTPTLCRVLGNFFPWT